MTATGRLGRYESAATIAGFAFSPLAFAAAVKSDIEHDGLAEWRARLWTR